MKTNNKSIFFMLKTILQRYENIFFLCLLEAFLFILSTYIPLFLIPVFLEGFIQKNLDKLAYTGACLFITQFLLTICETYIRNKRLLYARNMSEDNINKLYTKICKLPYETFKDGEIRTKYTSALEMLYYDFDYSDMANSVVEIIKDALNIALSVVLTFSVLLSIPEQTSSLFIAKPVVSVILFVGTITALLFLNIYVLNKKSEIFKKLISEHAEVESKLMYLQNSIIFNFSDYISYNIFNMNDMLASRFDENANANIKFFGKTRGLNVFTNTINSISSGVSMLFSFCILISKIYSGAISPIYIITYSQIMMKLHDSFFNISRTYGEIKRNLPFFENIEYVMCLEEEFEKESALSYNSSEKNKIIKFEDVYYKYPNSDAYAINGVSFEFELKGKQALIGENGSGKSTLILLMLGLIKPTKGAIYLDGVDINEIGVSKYRDVFSYSFQDTAIYPICIANNIAFKLNYDFEKMYNSLSIANVDEKFTEIDFLTNLSNNSFSGGQVQKFTSARTFYKSANVYVFDEPTSAMDALNEDTFYRNLMSFSEPVIFISHRMSSCKLCDNIIVLENGTISQFGTHSKLVDYEGKYKELWTAQAKTYN